MKRNYEIDPYIETIKNNEEFFKQYYYHSIIDLNLVKLDSILKYGLLSRNNIEEKNLLSFYLHHIRSYDCKNGKDYISLVDYDRLLKEKGGCSFHQMFEAFALHTLTSLSIMLDKDIKVSNKGTLESLFDDEVFAYESVDISHIKGIILPEHLIDMPICDIPFLPGDYYCYTKESINHLIDCMEVYFGKNISREELLASVNQLWELCEKKYGYGRENWIASAVEIQKKEYGVDIKDVLAKLMNELWQEKFNIENPTYIDIINNINSDRFPIYEIGQKSLRKIN